MSFIFKREMNVVDAGIGGQQAPLGILAALCITVVARLSMATSSAHLLRRGTAEDLLSYGPR